MNAHRRVACVLLVAAVLLAPPAYATAFSTDQSDLWYIPAESGWGMQLVQRNGVIFGTLFVYGTSGTPTWYVATMDYIGGGLVWTGDLYATTGPYFAAVPFNPADVAATKVGTMTWVAQSVDTGTLTYVVNGVTIVKNVVRETLVNDNFDGFYMGGLQEVVSGCANAALDGDFARLGNIHFVQNVTAVSISMVGPTGAACSFNGTLSQSGQMGAVQATPISCSDGSLGTVSFDELQVTPSGLTGTFAVSFTSPPGCQATGSLGGVRGNLLNSGPLRVSPQ